MDIVGNGWPTNLKTVKNFTRISPTTAEVDVGMIGTNDMERSRHGLYLIDFVRRQPNRTFWYGSDQITSSQAFNLFQMQKNHKTQLKSKKTIWEPLDED